MATAIEFTEQELFVLRLALEEARSITDREFRNVVKISDSILDRLPSISTKWEDVEYR